MRKSLFKHDLCSIFLISCKFCRNRVVGFWSVFMNLRAAWFLREQQNNCVQNWNRLWKKNTFSSYFISRRSNVEKTLPCWQYIIVTTRDTTITTNRVSFIYTSLVHQLLKGCFCVFVMIKNVFKRAVVANCSQNRCLDVLVIVKCRVVLIQKQRECCTPSEKYHCSC